jgi:integrase
VVTLSGKDHYLGHFGSPESREAYDRLLAEWLASRRRPAHAGCEPADLISINELLVAYWEHVRRYYVKAGEPTSEQDTIRQALRPVRQLYGGINATDFSPLALKAVRQAMIERGWCRTFINRQVNRVKKMFAWAAENDLVPIQVYQALAHVAGLRRGRTEAREKPPVRPVPDELVEQVLPHLSPTFATMVQLQRLTGMRPQEIILMRAVDIETSDPRCWIYRPHRHKSEHQERERKIFLGPRAQELLRSFLDREPTDYLFQPQAGRGAATRRTAGPSQVAPDPVTTGPPAQDQSEASTRRAVQRGQLPKGDPAGLQQARHPGLVP